jgi:hypothetical protein
LEGNILSRFVKVFATNQIGKFVKFTPAGILNL